MFQDLSNNLPVNWTKVGSKLLTTRQEELVRADVGEGPSDTGVPFYLMEGRFNIFGMESDVYTRAILTAKRVEVCRTCCLLLNPKGSRVMQLKI